MPPKLPTAVGILEWVRIAFLGLCMGIAEMIPGISGGTMAFILGFWSDLITSIKSINLSALRLLFTGQFRAFSATVGWRFLLALGIGNALAFVLLANWFHSLLVHEVYRCYLYGAFMGLVLASVFICTRKISHWGASRLIGLTLGAIAAYCLTSVDLKGAVDSNLFSVEVNLQQANPYRHQIGNYDSDKQLLTGVSQPILAAMISRGAILSDAIVYRSDGSIAGVASNFVVEHYKHPRMDWQLTGYGMIAIVAMLLPGVSGSYLLMVLGKYALVVGALSDFVTAFKSGAFDADAFFVLLSLGLGVVCGALLFAGVVGWMLKSYYETMLATLCGFMLGSLQAVWPFWSYQYSLLPLKLEKGPQLEVLHPILPDIASTHFLWVCALAVIGFAAVIVMDTMASRRRLVHGTSQV